MRTSRISCWPPPGCGTGRVTTDPALSSLARRRSRALTSGDERALALAHDRQLLASAFLGTGDDEGHGPAALELYRRLRDAKGEGRVYNNLGIAAYFVGDWERTTEMYAAAMERSEAAGDVVLAGIGAVNQAEILADQGHWTRAADLLDHVIRNWQSIGYEPGVAVALSFRGTALGRSGALDAAQSDLEDALGRSNSIGATSLVAGARLRLAELELLRGDVDGCREHLGRLDEMPEAEQSDIQHRSSLLRAIAELALDVPSGVVMLESMTGGADGFDEALALELLDRVAPLPVSRADPLAKRLGIVAFPPFPTLPRK